MDLSSLLGGKQFLVSCSLSSNGFGITLHSLVDSGANGFLFINRPLAHRLSKALSQPLRRLPYSVPVRGFKSDISTTVTHYIRLHLTIDGRRFYNCPFIIVDLGPQDLILGDKWLARFKLHTDSANRRILWPKTHPPASSFAREIMLPYESREIQRSVDTYESDMNRRDRNFVTDAVRRARAIPPTLQG